MRERERKSYEIRYCQQEKEIDKVNTEGEQVNRKGQREIGGERKNRKIERKKRESIMKRN